MTRRATTALLLCALVLGLAVVGTAVDREPEPDTTRVTAYLDAPDVEPDLLPDVAPLLVAVLGAAAASATLGPWTAAPTSRRAAPAPVVRRRNPARGPPPR